MISDSQRRELTLLAIRHRFSGLRTDVREVADRLLNAGVDHDDLIVIYLAGPDDKAAIFAAFDRFLNACEIHVPDQDDAIWGLIEFHVDKIARREADPFELLRGMMNEVYYEYDLHSLTKEFVGGSHGIDSLVGLFFNYGAMTEHHDDVSWNDKDRDAALDKLRIEIVQAAEEWLENNEGLGIRAS